MVNKTLPCVFPEIDKQTTDTSLPFLHYSPLMQIQILPRKGLIYSSEHEGAIVILT